jgi:hypothetical protein
LVKGIPEGGSKKCFNEFFERLGKCYWKRNQQGFDVYHDIRCGLVHSNVIDKNAEITIEGVICGVVYDPASKKYLPHVRLYFEDLKKDNYLSGLVSGSEDVSLMKKALIGKPELV